MWLFTKYGFYSVVQVEGDPDRLQIRARRRQDLDRIRKLIGLTGLKIIETTTADYRFRMIVDRATFGLTMIRLVDDLTYTNFKDAVHEEAPEDFPYHDALMAVWGTMVQLQHEENLKGPDLLSSRVLRWQKKGG